MFCRSSLLAFIFTNVKQYENYVLLLGCKHEYLLKEKNFENYLEKNNNLSRATMSLRIYGYQLINKFVNLNSKIIEFKKLDDPDEEMEELLQDWVNYLVKNPPKKRKLTPIVLKQYANAVNAYLKYYRFRIDIRALKFPKQLYEEKYPIIIEEIQSILKAAKWFTGDKRN